MRSEPVLLLPGPTPVPEDVRQACARQVTSHRSEEFAALYDDVRARLREMFGTRGEVVVYPSSGTGAMEAALVNTLSPGERVLAVVAGAFGERFAAMASALGLEVDRLEVPWGSVPGAAELAEALQGRGYRAVLLTHSETSTGALLPVAELAAAVRAALPEALVIVDAVSSFAAVPFAMDAWGVDVALTGSQKALMTPPGLGIVALGPRGLAAMEEARLPRFAWDARRYLKGGSVPYTPAVTLWFGLRAALDRIRREGVEAVFRRHRLLSAMVRAGVRAAGLDVLAPDACASPTVTAVLLPPGLSPGELAARMARDYGVVVAEGMGPFARRAFRIGHMGAVMPEDVLAGLAALDGALAAMGHAAPGSAREAAERLLAEPQVAAAAGAMGTAQAGTGGTPRGAGALWVADGAGEGGAR